MFANRPTSVRGLADIPRLKRPFAEIGVDKLAVFGDLGEVWSNKAGDAVRSALVDKDSGGPDTFAQLRVVVQLKLALALAFHAAAIGELAGVNVPALAFFAIKELFEAFVGGQLFAEEGPVNVEVSQVDHLWISIDSIWHTPP